MQKAGRALIDVAIAAISDARLPRGAGGGVPAGRRRVRAREAGCHRVRATRGGSQRVPVHSWDDPALGDAVARWTRGTWAKVEPHTFGFYVNEFNADDAARLRDTYGANFDRLVALKTKYDPEATCSG